jgi:hypothetical protein
MGIIRGDVRDSWGRLSSLPSSAFHDWQAGKPVPQDYFSGCHCWLAQQCRSFWISASAGTTVAAPATT